MREDSIVRYENFDLQIERATRSRFRARVLHSPVGSGVECTFSLPFADATLTQMRSIQLLELDAIREFGQSLYTSVFADRVGVLLSSSLQRLQRINHASQQQTQVAFLGDQHSPPTQQVDMPFVKISRPDAFRTRSGRPSTKMRSTA